MSHKNRNDVTYNKYIPNMSIPVVVWEVTKKHLTLASIFDAMRERSEFDIVCRIRF